MRHTCYQKEDHTCGLHVAAYLLTRLGEEVPTNLRDYLRVDEGLLPSSLDKLLKVNSQGVLPGRLMSLFESYGYKVRHRMGNIGVGLSFVLVWSCSHWIATERKKPGGAIRVYDSSGYIEPTVQWFKPGQYREYYGVGYPFLILPHE